MDNFNANISIEDCLVCKCNTCNKMITEIITSTEQFVPLQHSFYLKIIAVNTNSVVISIDNDLLFIVRRLYVGVPIRICIPNKCCKHTLTIVLNSIVTT